MNCFTNSYHNSIPRFLKERWGTSSGPGDFKGCIKKATFLIYEFVKGRDRCYVWARLIRGIRQSHSTQMESSLLHSFIRVVDEVVGG